MHPSSGREETWALFALPGLLVVLATDGWVATAAVVTAVLTRPRPGGSAGAVRASCDRAVRHLASPGDLRRHGTTARADRNTRQLGIDPSALGGQVGLPIGTAVTARDPDPHSPDPPPCSRSPTPAASSSAADPAATNSHPTCPCPPQCDLDQPAA
jgi:hypothetical protein